MERISSADFQYSEDERLEEPLQLFDRRTRKKNSNLLVLAHGLGGSRSRKKPTWGAFPSYLWTDLPDFDLALFGYRTLRRRARFWKSVELETEATTLIAELRELRDYSNIILAGHSLGGLLVKCAVTTLIRNSAAARDELLSRLAGLILAATPQLGSGWVPSWMPAVTNDLRALKSHSALATAMASTFTDRVSCLLQPPSDDRTYLPTFCLMANEDLWVDPLSAGISVPSEQTHRSRGSHTSIVKPKSRDSAPYKFFLRAVTACRDAGRHRSRSTEVRKALSTDLVDVERLARDFFPHASDQLSSLATVNEWWSANRQTIWVVESISRGAGPRATALEGYLCLVPLRRNVADELKGGLRGIAQVRGSEVVPANERPDAVYIGAIAAASRATSAAALERLKVELEHAARGERLEVLTRPITREGLQVAENRGFLPVNPSQGGLGNLYYLWLEPDS